MISRFLLDYSFSVSGSLWVAALVLSKSAGHPSLVSSANMMTMHSITSSRLLIKMLNWIGPVVSYLSQAFTLGKIVLTVPSDLLLLNVPRNVLQQDSCHEFPRLICLEFSGLNFWPFFEHLCNTFPE